MNIRRTPLILLFSTLFVTVFFACQSQELTSAKLYIQQENWEEAEKFLKQAEAKEPENPEIPFLLGAEIYARQGNWEQMNKAFNRSLSISNEYAEQIEQIRLKYWTDNFNLGAKKYNNALEAQGQKRTQQLKDAVQNFEAAVSILPSRPQTYGSLATAYLLLENIEQAKKTFSRALDEDPENFPVLFNYGRLVAEEGNTEKAIDLLEKAHSIKPEEVDVVQLLANLYVKNNQQEKALDMYSQAIEQDTTGNANLYFNKSILHIQIAQSLEQEGDSTQAEKQYSNAIDAMKNAVDLNPDDTEALIRLGELYQEMEMWKDAAATFRKVLDEQPENVSVLRKLAVSVYRLGDPERGQELLNKAKKLEKEDQGSGS